MEDKNFVIEKKRESVIKEGSGQKHLKKYRAPQGLNSQCCTLKPDAAAPYRMFLSGAIKR